MGRNGEVFEKRCCFQSVTTPNRVDEVYVTVSFFSFWSTNSQTFTLFSEREMRIKLCFRSYIARKVVPVRNTWFQSAAGVLIARAARSAAVMLAPASSVSLFLNISHMLPTHAQGRCQ